MNGLREIVHSEIPPCSCRDCLRATARADQRKAEIDGILRRFAELDLNIQIADQLDRGAGNE